jgi:hypothetical protein
MAQNHVGRLNLFTETHGKLDRLKSKIYVASSIENLKIEIINLVCTCSRLIYFWDSGNS